MLARTVSAAGGRDDIAADVTRDAAILSRVLRAINGPGRPPLRQLLAALRVLGQSAGPADQLATPELSREQRAALLRLTGRGAAELVAGRAWTMEAALRGLAPLASGPGQPASPLSVAWLDRQAPAAVNDVLAAYLPIALTAALRQAPPTRRWQHSVVLLGAERLRGDVIDRLCAAAEIAGTGLMLCYRTIPAPVRERLGRGHAAVGFMRLGNAEDARAAAEQIGTEHRFVVSQLTDTVGSSVTDTIGASYTSSDGTADSVADSVSRTATTGRSRSSGRSGQAPLAGLAGPVSADASRSTAVSATRSISQGITAGTSWGWSTSRAVAASDSLARTSQRSRESVVEPHELQQLPQSAVLLCYPAAGGRQVVLADANPAIIALPSATLARSALAGCDSC